MIFQFCVILLTSKIAIGESSFDYILSINTDYRIADFMSLIVTDNKHNVAVIREYIIGKREMLRIQCSEKRATELLKVSSVLGVEKDVKVYQASGTSDTKCMEQDMSLVYQWGLARISSRTKVSIADEIVLDKYSYSDAEQGGGVNVYVMDSGVYVDHMEFGGRVRRGITVQRLMEMEGHADLNGHGTQVAGVIAGGVFGVAKKSNIISVKMMGENGEGMVSDLLEALEWIIADFTRTKEVEGCRAKGVVNMSFGFPTVSVSVENSILEGRALGLVFVAAAGNYYADASLWSPGSIPEVITVAATTYEDKFANFSNYGASVDILAPGEHISTAGIQGPDSVFVASGTSIACPFVAGVIARNIGAKEVMPTPDQVLEELLSTASTAAISGMKESTPNVMLYASCGSSVQVDANCSDRWGPDQDNDAEVIAPHHYWMIILFLTLF